MQEPNFLSQEAGLNFNSVVEAIVKRSCIIDYGIIQDIVADGVVDVSLAVAHTEQDIVCMTCVLANIASSAFTLNVVPHKGDRVLVVYPRMYHDKMFSVTEDEDSNTELTLDFGAKGYNLASGIAILINQYKEAGHKNVITVDNGNVSAVLNKVEITTTSDGDIAVSNGKATTSIDKDGAVSVSNDKATASIDKDGNVVIDTQGKYTVKNNDTDLMKVIDELAKAVEQLTTTGSETAQSASPATVAQVGTWRTNQLNKFFTSVVPPEP